MDIIHAGLCCVIHDAKVRFSRVLSPMLAYCGGGAYGAVKCLFLAICSPCLWVTGMMRCEDTLEAVYDHKLIITSTQNDFFFH